MILEGKYTFQASPDIIWKLLISTVRLAGSLPESLLIMRRLIISPTTMPTDCIQPWAIKRHLNHEKEQFRFAV